jgi:hypothetical protein
VQVTSWVKLTILARSIPVMDESLCHSPQKVMAWGAPFFPAPYLPGLKRRPVKKPAKRTETVMHQNHAAETLNPIGNTTTGMTP